MELLRLRCPFTESEEEGGGQLDLPTEPMEEKLAITITIKQILLELEERDRKLILLRYFRGRTQSEAAEEDGDDTSTSFP